MSNASSTYYIMANDSDFTEWFWHNESKSWVSHGNLATNFPDSESAYHAREFILSRERFADPTDRMADIEVHKNDS